MIKVWPISALGDNYIWILERSGSRSVAVVDPGDAAPVEVSLAERGLEIACILLTHHHGDHTGGVSKLVSGAETPVYAPAADHIQVATQDVAGGDRVSIPELDLELEVLEVPGHTRGHGAYLGDGFVLVGDTLFAGGCGRIFEGTAEQMHGSLTRLAQLPPATLVYCAHEYTVANLRFAMRVEPGNAALAERLEKVEEIRRKDQPTVPSTIEVELATNPFLRCNEPEVVAAARRFAGSEVKPGVETFATIRRWKDGA